jgi:hypothetical protein
MLVLRQSHFHTLLHELFEQLLEQPRFLKPPVPVLGERGVMRYLLIETQMIETQTREPAPRQMHAQFFHQLGFAAEAIQKADQQNAQQEFRINRGPTGVVVAASQSLAHKLKTDVLVDQPQQMVFGNLILQTEVVKQRFGAIVLPHHDQQVSENRNQTERGQDHLLLTCFC